MKGIRQLWMGERIITVGGRDYSPEELVARLQSLLDAQRATSKAYAAWRAQVAREKALGQELVGLTRLLGLRVTGLYGERVAKLAAFGVSKHKTGPKTLESKLQTIDTAKATRATRGTQGKRRKLQIKGKPPRAS